MAELRSQRHRILVEPDDVGLRLDQLLAAKIEELSRNKARIVLDLGGVFVDGKRVKNASRKLQAGTKVDVHLGGALQRASKETGREARARDEAKLPAYKLLFEDRRMVVVDKPSGLLTAPTPESDRNNLASILQRRARNGNRRLHVVHRLDLETSGVLVFAKGGEANRRLSELFRSHDLTRQYLAVVAGAFPEGETICEVEVGGKAARTTFGVLERFGARATLVRATLDTGRTHQIRIHARALGRSVLGDRKYGRRTDHDPPRLALHAARLAFQHPHRKMDLDFRSPLPKELARWLERLAAGQERSKERSDK
jgi:23S rRNA pseudouridine1911/1915/1917 synthase